MRNRVRIPGLLLILIASLMSAQAPPRTPAQERPARIKARAAAAAAARAPAKFFPYEVQTKSLPNGLAVIVIRTPEFKDMATYATAVYSGSRNETQKGKTGLAHLFEHIMFLHEYGGRPGGYEAEIRRMGASNNAWTDYDMTFYHPTTFTANLEGPISRPGGPVPGLIELEASRFKGLKLDQKTFQVEAGAVLGEYRRIFSDPREKMVEQFSPVAFPNHPYGHTVIGYYDDVVNMPNAWDAAWEYYGNYYKPNNVAIVVAGDVDPQAVFAEVEKDYADWKPSHPPQIPPENLESGPKNVHVSWEADVSPQLMVAYHTPATKPGSKETAVSQILPELLVSRSAPLFQKLRYQKQTVTDFGIYGDTEFIESTDPHLLVLNAEMDLDRLRKNGDKYVADVQNDITSGVDDLKTFSKQPNAAQTLAVVKSKVKNDFLATFDSTLDIARQFAWYYRFDRDPQALDRLMQAVDSLTPADIDAYAAEYLTTDRRIITTLWKGQGQQSAAPGGSEVK